LNISVTQAESKRVVAIIGHLRQIVRSVVDSNGYFLRPVFVDQSEIILASASLRSLLFDDSPSPLLIDFFRQHKMPAWVETIEAGSAMLLLSELEPGAGPHMSDFFMGILEDEKMREDFKLNEPHSFVTVMQEGSSVLSSLHDRINVWAPGMESKAPVNTSLGYQPGTGICQYTQVTRKIVNLEDWGNVRIGYLKNIPIRRRSIICYVANKLGGVHYDSTRIPRNPLDLLEFNALAMSYDWESQAVTHAGIIAVALACIELTRSEFFLPLLSALEIFHMKRQERLRSGLPLVQTT
jgi:hypothetical protein